MPETADEMPEPDRETEMEESRAADAEDEDMPPEPESDAEPDQDAASEGIHRLRPPEAEESATEADDSSASEGWSNLYRMLDVPLSLTVELGATEMPLSEVLNLEAGSVITIDRAPGEPIDLLINGRLFARGEVVVINETFGCRITELVDDAATTIEIARNGG